MRNRKALGRAIGAATLTGALTLGVFGSTAAGAAQSEEQVTCDGHDLTIRTNDNRSSDNGGWSSVQILSGGSGHLTPTSFNGSAFDETVGKTIFSFSAEKGNGNANNHQQQVTCNQVSSGPLGDLLEPGEQPPPGTSTSDQVTFTFTATVVQH